MAGLQSGEDRKMIASVVWAQYINVADTQTDTQRDRQTALRRAAKINVISQDLKRNGSRWSLDI